MKNFFKLILFIPSYLKILTLIKKNLRSNKQSAKSVIYVEIFNYYPVIVYIAYFLKAFTSLFPANIQSYYPTSPASLRNFVSRNFFLNQIMYRFFYRYIGSDKSLTPRLINNSLVEKIFKKTYLKLKNKKDVLNIQIFKIPVGEFIYDGYLRENNKATIDVNSELFKKYLLYSIKTFYFWYKEFENPKKVAAIITTHPSYLMGLVGRIGVYKKIPVYCINNVSIVKLDRNHLYRYSISKDYPAIYKKIPHKIKKILLKKAKKQIINYSNQFRKKIANKKENRNDLILSKNNKKNILIAAHCFTDAVHVMGTNSVFPDHYEWMDFLGKISEKNLYNFYIKVHPTHYDLNIKKMEVFLKKYKYLKLLPKNSTLGEIVSKIDYVFSVYGTIGREFPLYNVPVINASTDNLHASYDFNINFQSKKKYTNFILNLNKLPKYKITSSKKKQILEYFVTRYHLHYGLLYNSSYILKVNKLIDQKIIDQFDLSKVWLDNFNLVRHFEIIEDMKSYVIGKQVCFLADNTGKHSKFLRL